MPAWRGKNLFQYVLDYIESIEQSISRYFLGMASHVANPFNGHQGLS